LGETYYIKVSDDERQKMVRRKCLSAAGPIIIFFGVMGVMAFTLAREFNIFYPGIPNQNHGKYEVPSHSSVTNDINYNSLDKNTSKFSSVSDCEMHPKCSSLNLEGKCCPTNDGTQLNCCN